MLCFLSAKEKIVFAIGFLSAIVAGPIICVWAFFFSTAIGDLTSPDHDDVRSAMISILFAFQVLAGVTAVSEIGRIGCFRYLGESQAASIKSRYFQALLRQEPAWHDSQSSSAHISRFSYQIPKLKPAFDTNFSLMVLFLAKGTGSLIFALSADVKLSLAVLSILPLIAVSFTVFSRIASQTSTRQARAYERGAAVATEDLGLLRTIWTFCTQAFEQRRLVAVKRL
jgi:ATP-binding cassette subfamily B (MDR/TAP) protein 1